MVRIDSNRHTGSVESAPTFPRDDNGDVLRRMHRDGDDLSKPRDIDFTVVMPTLAAAEELGQRMRTQGHAVKVTRTACVAHLPWDVRIVKHMLPTHADIGAFEEELAVLAAPQGGRNDGWGCWAQ